MPANDNTAQATGGWGEELKNEEPKVQAESQWGADAAVQEIKEAKQKHTDNPWSNADTE